MVSIELNYGKSMVLMESMVSIDWRENQQEQWMKNGHLEYSPVIEELNTLSDGKKRCDFPKSCEFTGDLWLKKWREGCGIVTR